MVRTGLSWGGTLAYDNGVVVARCSTWRLLEEGVGDNGIGEMLGEALSAAEAAASNLGDTGQDRMVSLVL
jgi:hypothetical protein